MVERKAGDTIGHVPRSIQMRFLDYNLRKGAAWRQIETLAEEELKLFGELDREFDLGDWVYSIDNVLGAIILERHKTMQERELMEVQRELIENGEGKVTE